MRPVTPFKAIGKDLLKANGHTNIPDAFLQFQAYIRQARTFFEAAEVLHHRASPLNYYYAFMNFAKAYILLRTPGFVDKNLVHGLKHKAHSNSLKRQDLKVLQYGVFPLFYRCLTNAAIPQSGHFKIIDLLGYVSEVSHEYRLLNYGDARYYRCRFAICITPANIAFATIAVHVPYPPLSIDLTKAIVGKKYFDAVSLPQELANAAFGLTGEEPCLFFESKPYPQADIPKIPAEVAAHLSPIISYLTAREPFLFMLNRKIRMPRLAPMQEMLAIYCCMYHLGSLVRYRPDILEAMLSTKDAWLIERFTKSAPLAFLRHIRNLIGGEYQIFINVETLHWDFVLVFSSGVSRSWKLPIRKSY